jgi:hypothetical protein
MNRRAAAVLAVAVASMLVLGVVLLSILRSLLGATTEEDAAGEIGESYAAEVEERCDDRYPRFSLRGPRGESCEAAARYLAARDLMKDLDVAPGRDARAEPSSPQGTGEAPVAAPSEVARLVTEGAGCELGRSPYAFCAIDTQGSVLLEYRVMADGLARSARDGLRRGDESAAASLLAATVIMELDLARGGGVFGQAVSGVMVEDTLRGPVAAFAGSARDAAAVQWLAGRLAGIEGSWPDLADNVRIDALVMETMYAACFMPEGWRSPVGPPVIERHTQRSICDLGPLVLSETWSSVRETSDETLAAFSLDDPRARQEKLAELDRTSRDSSVVEKLLDPGRMLTAGTLVEVAPHHAADLRARALLNLTRAALALRRRLLETGELVVPGDADLWDELDAGRPPLVDPVGGTRPVVEVAGGELVVRYDVEFPGWKDDPPSLHVPWSSLDEDVHDEPVSTPPSAPR